MDKLTERLTKDLNGYNEYFANELENLIGKRADELAPLYRRLQKTAVEQLEQLNKELETVPEAKRKSKRLRVQMQKQYIAHILPDLELAKAAQDPYVTEVLCGTVEYGYYTQAYSLEQAAKVPVTVPVLNRAGVLGLIANDWVGDGHTYSDRIRANTDLVAKNAEKVIQDLVTKRMSYNEAAHSLKDKIGERYSNAVRIVRTEMTRANSLGTSYAAMENADILDGKYRDAVYDGRTSAMCAHDADYSRANPYPLDYDTPANPGVPGARIPNHPNCRCRWCTVLSAIGVEKRGKIARKNGTNDSFGENYYTEAETFDNYAKERGLPSVKEMLDGDNPKRYLRPGETLDDLNKKVKRVKFNGKTVVVSKAVWDNDTTVKKKAVEKSVENDIINNTRWQPAQTTAEATAWGQNNLGIKYVDYTGFSVDVANDVNKTLDELRRRFPQITDTKIVSTSQNLCTLQYQRSVEEYIKRAVDMGYDEGYARKLAATYVKKKKVPGNTYAWSTNHTWGDLEGITFNKKYASNFKMFVESLESDVKSGWHPPGTATPAAVLTHEFGHQIDNYLKKIGRRGWVQTMYTEMQAEATDMLKSGRAKTPREAYAQLLSDYGSKNSAEFLAEAFSEYIHSPTPRTIAKKVGEKIVEMLKDIK